MRLLAFALLLLTSRTLFADCECLWQGSFAEVHTAADLIVAGAVVATKGNSIDFKRLRTLRGAAHPETVRIWLRSADYCRPDTEEFPPGSSWVLALQRIEEAVPGGFNPGTPNISYGRVGDYTLSSCGGYWLTLADDVVTGNLVGAPRWERDPKMTPVRLDLLDAFVRGEVPVENVEQAAAEDPALRELMLDTRAFLRGEP